MFTSGDFPRLCLWLEGEQEHRLLPVLFLRQNVSAISKSFTSLRTCELEIHLIVQMPIDLLTGLFTLVMVLLQEYQDMPPDMVLIPPFAETQVFTRDELICSVLGDIHSATPENFCEQHGDCTMLSVKNLDVTELDNNILEQFPGET